MGNIVLFIVASLLEGCDLLIGLGSLFLDRMYVIQCVEFIGAYGFDVKLDCE